MGRKIVTIGLIVIAVLAIAFLLGPRVAVDTTVTLRSRRDRRRSRRPIWPPGGTRVKGVRPGQQKEIIWADPATKAKTPLRSSTSTAFRPRRAKSGRCPTRSRRRSAPIFSTPASPVTARTARDGGRQRQRLDQRLCRGDRDRPGDRRQGGGDRHLDRRVAGDLGGGASRTFRTDVATIIAISPNYGLQAAGADLLTAAVGRADRRADDRQGARLRAGQRAECAAVDDEISDRGAAAAGGADEARLRARRSRRSRIPALFIFSDDDAVVRPELTREIAGRWGARHELVPVEARRRSASTTCIAGDALSPATTQVLADRIVAWVKAVAG